MTQRRNGLNSDLAADTLSGKAKVCKRLGWTLTLLVEFVIFCLWLPNGTPVTGRNLAFAATRAGLYVSSSGMGYMLVTTIQESDNSAPPTWVTTTVEKILGVENKHGKNNRKRRETERRLDSQYSTYRISDSHDMKGSKFSVTKSGITMAMAAMLLVYTLFHCLVRRGRKTKEPLEVFGEEGYTKFNPNHEDPGSPNILRNNEDV